MDKRIDVAVIESSRLKFELLPIDRRLDGVTMKRLYRAPHLRQLAGPCARVVNLAPKDQKWLAVYQQRVAAVFLNDSGCLDGRAAGKRHQGENERSCKSLERGGAYEVPEVDQDHNRNVIA
jgi:hypothetical protein